MAESSSVLKKKNVTVTTPSSVIGSFTALEVVDKVCIIYNNVCASQVEFYADLTGWAYWNILGLAPVNAAEGPNLVRMLY